MRATKVAYDGAQSTTVFRTCQWFCIEIGYHRLQETSTWLRQQEGMKVEAAGKKISGVPSRSLATQT